MFSFFKKFQKNKEDFTCEKCGKEVVGGGYTNHCPECLYSKHVDVNPGDRQASCGWLMAPVTVTLEQGGFVITHRCEKCQFEKKNKMAENDNMGLAIAIVKGTAEKFEKGN